MARYIKANPLVAKFLHVENDRNRVTDGNYLLWQADILAFGKLIDLPQILEKIGAIALMAHEARQEQDGTVVRELPTATDPRFVVTKNEAPADAKTESTEEPAQPTEDKAESTEVAEEPAEETAQPSEATESETPNTETV